jgi:N-acylneuraminate cytidylyltransferase
MNIVAFIPARGGSKGIHKKNIVDFHGSPLLKYTINVCKKSKYINRIYVSSDDLEILNLAKEYGANIIERPPEISHDQSPTEDAIKHFIDSIDEVDLIVFLQATSPLREVNDINGLIEEVIKNDLDSAFTACPLEDFFIWQTEPKLHSINYDYRNRKRRQDINDQVVENGSIYCFKTEMFKKNNNRLGGKIGYYLMDKWKIHEIDTEEDVELCKFLYKSKGLNNE